MNEQARRQEELTGIPTRLADEEGTARLKGALRNLRLLVSCRCDEVWTSRGLHEPYCRSDHGEDLDVVEAGLNFLGRRLLDAADLIEADCDDRASHYGTFQAENCPLCGPSSAILRRLTR